MKKNIIKISLAGVVASVVVSTASFSVAASAVPTESPVESTKEYDDIQKMFLAIDKDTTEDDLLKLIEEYEVAYTAEDYNGTRRKDAIISRSKKVQRFRGMQIQEILWRYLLIKMMARYYMQNTLIMRLSWMRFIIIMVRIGILVKMSRVMCIRDIITISQEIQKVALL